MRNLVLFIVLVGVSANCFSQAEKENTPSIYQGQYQTEIAHYVGKYKRQRTVAWVLLGGGLALNTLASSMLENSSDINSGYQTLSAVGGLATIGSIPMFFISGKNKHNAQQYYFQQKIEAAVSDAEKQSYMLEASDYFMSKAKGNTIVGSAMAAMTGIFVIAAISANNKYANSFDEAVAPAAYAGAAVTFGALSIPFFVRAAKLRNTGLLIMKTGRMPLPEVGSLSPTFRLGKQYVALGLQLEL